MNGLQIYLLGCLLAYPIAVGIAKILKEPDGLLKKTQATFKELNFEKSLKFFYNCIVFGMVFLSWTMVVLWLYIHIKYLFSVIKYYLFRK